MLDAVIIGAGHNGLVCAFYLARAGLKVRLYEARGVVGGAAVTEEFAPGFRNSTASYTVSLLQPKVIAEMGLERRGYRVIERPVSNFLPLGDGHLVLGGGLERTQAEFARFSTKDAAALPGYYEMLEGVAEVLRDLALRIPPDAGGGPRALLDAVMQSRKVARLPLAAKRDVLALFTRSAREVLDAWFESDPVKAAFGFDACVGNYASPDAPGSAYVLLHHVFGEVNGKKGAWGHVPGGMGTITRLMAEAVREAGGEIVTDAPVGQVLVERGRAVGLSLASGEEVRAARVIANLGPKPLFDRLVPRDVVPRDFARAMDMYAGGSGSLRMNLALSGLPKFRHAPTGDEHLKAGIVIAPSLDYMDRAWRDARDDGFSKAPIVEMLIPSLVDDSLAPPGQHVASLFCQHVDPDLPEDREKEAVEAVLATIEHHAPGFRAQVLHTQVHSPRALEAKFGLWRGDIFHGRMSLDQLWSARPALGAGSYRTPVPGLWLCGSGTHPGGGVTGAPGHNCAHAVLKERWNFLRR
ncbi:Phytoene desaturase (lycopene-forming) [Tsuneonella dongtanensis]|uniref:Pyridine nucleotide-disulfide oxidoreductase domain-containing protein 2 n=1 Tax=Tsuneonella dongtanensis TaxID=692370 RepID=A0A1B2AAR2_9SPHN|nr:NAD(P)/FAD-dependent oxidoreductase [Tsuneonella dongtanensis]ANY19191.1 Phytoene desaturase (lycopene-forming) [Tsuneonella dongtanensis]